MSASHYAARAAIACARAGLSYELLVDHPDTIARMVEEIRSDPSITHNELLDAYGAPLSFRYNSDRTRIFGPAEDAP